MFKRYMILFCLCLIILKADELITPIPQEMEYDKKKAKLGKKLFFDKILSHDRTISCESCHHLKNVVTGADSKPVSMGVSMQNGELNSPTVLNSRLNFAQFWDGRAPTLKDQAYGPLYNPIEMGMTEKLVGLRLDSNEKYKKMFKTLYKDGVTVDNVVDAIVEFEKALITPNSKFDRYLSGVKTALSPEEKRGYENFKALGCVGCHNGVNMGGNMIQEFGVYEKSKASKDSKHYNYDGKKMLFKVPSLRNISKTAPYFHDGRVKTLREAIDIMVHYQLGYNVSKKVKDSIYKFLLTLDGERPKILDE